MTSEIALTLAILAAAVVLFVTERLRVDTVALLVLISLALTGLVTPSEALSGFSNPAVVTVWAMFVLGGGLSKTGVANLIGRQVLRLAGQGESRLVIAIMLVGGAMSAFMNNVAVTAMLLPVVVDIARRTGRPPSKLLIPLAFGSLLGGMNTLIGTPPNLLVSMALGDYGLRPFQLFDYTPVGLAVTLAGVAYMVLVGRHLLPARDLAPEPPGLDLADLRRFYDLGDRLFAVRVPHESALADTTLAESRLGAALDLNVVGITRNNHTFLSPGPEERLEAGDTLLVEGNIEDLHGLQYLEIERQPPPKLHDLESERVGLAEFVLSPHTTLVGKTLRQLDFRAKYGLNVLAIWRQGRAYRSGLRDLALRFGDALLLYGPREKLRVLGREPDFLVLAEEIQEAPRLNKAPLAVLVMGAVLLSVALGWLTIPIAAVGGATLMVLTGCLNMEESYRFIEWKAVFLISGMLPLGIAMEQSGAARLLAESTVAAVGGLGPMAVLAGLFVVTALAAQVIPTHAVAVLMAPIAFNIASAQGISPYALAMVVASSTSASFLLPVGHPSNVLIMGPGAYRFSDYAKVGAPLTLVMLLVVMLVVPLFWPLFP
jgi:di/tricarboxylate transporter